MDSRTLMWGLAALTILFIVLNFTVAGAGTAFLILAVFSAIATGYLFITQGE